MRRFAILLPVDDSILELPDEPTNGGLSRAGAHSALPAPGSRSSGECKPPWEWCAPGSLAFACGEKQLGLPLSKSEIFPGFLMPVTRFPSCGLKKMAKREAGAQCCPQALIECQQCPAWTMAHHLSCSRQKDPSGPRGASTLALEGKKG
jgi:hypothetical protein